VLLANMIDDLNLHILDSGVPVAFFFCRHDISESLKASTVIGSLARQLLRPILLLHAELQIGQTAQAMDSEQILGILGRFLPNDTWAYILVDGLDECEEKEVELLV